MMTDAFTILLCEAKSQYANIVLQGFKSRIEDVREEILRKRRAGKLPGDTTSVLKTWWQQHSKWPYPTVSNYQSHHLFMIFHNHNVHILAGLASSTVSLCLSDKI
jgi:hypothetical protein